MTTGPRRILVSALLGALVGLGLVAVLFAVLFGRRPRTGTAEIAVPAPTPSPALPPSPPSAPALPLPARRRGGGRLTLAAGLAGLLLLLAGGIFANRDALFGPRFFAPDGGRSPTALSPPQADPGDAPAPRAEAPFTSPSQPDRPAAAGQDSIESPESQRRPDAGDTAARPPRPRMKADATVPRGRRETSDPATVRAGAEAERVNGPPSSASSNPAETPRPPGRPVAGAAEPPLDTPAKVVGGETAEITRLPLTGRASLGTGLQLVLNDPRIAPATVDRDGSVTFGVNRDLRPGADAVRLDAAAGQLRERAGIPLSAPVPQRDGDIDVRRERSSEPDDPQPFSTGSVSTRAPPRTGAGAAEARGSGIVTILVTRGDSLWSISRRTYGKGRRYTWIHDANPDRVRDPNLIRPGQILVLPRRAAEPR